MALKTKLKTGNGIELAAAVLVVGSLTDVRTKSNYNYSIAKAQAGDRGGKLYVQNIRDEESRRTQFQVSIFASEEILRQGKPSIGFLHNKNDQPAFVFQPNDKSDLSLVEQAYQSLLEQYPNAEEVDLSELGLI